MYWDDGPLPNKTMREMIPFACDMTAIAPEDRDRHMATAYEVFQAVQSVRELPNGYAFRLPNNTTMLLKTAEFIANERLCCPFFGFTLEIEPDGGPLWVRLTGREGVKPFIVAELGEALTPAITHALSLGA